jgi:hypothetical protein
MDDDDAIDPLDPEEPIDLGPHEKADIAADLDDLGSMRAIFSKQGVKGVVIACEDCGANHFYEWELLRDNLDQMLRTGEPRMHEPAFHVNEDEYVEWDYAKGYIDALADTGLEPDRKIEVTQCPWCETPAEAHFLFCPRCGRSLGAVRLYKELMERGIPDREVRALLVRAGYEPF